MIYLQLFVVFFRVGLFSIGGGLAAMPLLQVELSRVGWVGHQEFIDMLAVSQATPGSIGINMATYAGYKTASVGGAVVATAGMVAPSLIIILLIARFLKHYQHMSGVRHALGVLRAVSAGMIAAVTWFILAEALGGSGSAGLPLPVDVKAIGMFMVFLAAYWKTNGNPVLFILAGGLAGMAVF